MNKTTFEIQKMDCPSEENLIRVKLNELPNIKSMQFDLANRTLVVYHEENNEKIKETVRELNLNEKILSVETVFDYKKPNETDQRKILWAVLTINFTFFIIEIITGLLSGSMGLTADSLDMLADAFVYGISIYAVGGTILIKKRIAKTSGYFQMILALLGFTEVVRRFIGMEGVPDFKIMILVSLFALAANSICLYLLQRSKSDEAHMQASMIFTSNDVIINLGVIAAGVMVIIFKSGIPDLIIGSIVFIIVMRGALRILKLGN